MYMQLLFVWLGEDRLVRRLQAPVLHLHRRLQARHAQEGVQSVALDVARLKLV